MPVVPARAARLHAEYRIERQTADALNNVGGDQYNAYVQQERESFLRDIAATKTKARRLVWIGFFSSSSAEAPTAGRSWTSLPTSTSPCPRSATRGFPNRDSLFGPQVAGMPVGLVGFAGAFIGMVLMIVGLVLHVVAAARRRRLQETAPAAQEWFAQARRA